MRKNPINAETLEQWAARVAPDLCSDAWREAERDVRSHRKYEERSKALLAYRDKVAAGLGANPKAELRAALDDESVSGGSPYHTDGRTAGALWNRGLVTFWKGVGSLVHLTDFGREVARVLGGDR